MSGHEPTASTETGFVVPNNRFAELTKILAPPPQPADYDERYLQWNQNVLSTKLPDDFIEFGRIPERADS